MNEKEVSEIRRRFRPEKNNITSIRGCYVNKNKEIISEFHQSLALMPEDETEKFVSILKKTLSGTLNKNLLDIEFSTQQVIDSEEHRLLMALKESSLQDEDAIHNFFQKAIDSVTLEENYLILLIQDTYDVPYRSKDGDRQDDASSEVFSYILCSICPVKMKQPALGYYVNENTFRNCTADWIVSPPELGFLFPAFDDRSTNLYNALYYTRDISENHSDFVEAVFHCETPMAASVQRETFQTIISGALAEECNFETVQAVNEQLQGMIAEHKESKTDTPLTVSKDHIVRLLQDRGVSDSHVAYFKEQFDEQFGPDQALSPKNIVDAKQIVVTAPDIKIQVTSDRNDLVETRIINGVKYILIRAEEGVEVNGIPVRIS